MADKRNRTPFYGAVPTTSLQADHVYMAGGGSVQDALTKKYELIETITITEAVTLIERSTTPGGDAYNFSALKLDIVAPAVASNTNMLTFINDVQILQLGCFRTTANYAFEHFEVNKGLLQTRVAITMGQQGNPSSTQTTRYGEFTILDAITSLKLTATEIPVDTVINIYAVKI